MKERLGMATEIRPQRKSVARESGNDLSKQGLSPRGKVHWNLIAPELFQAAARRGEGEFADMGPFVAVTSPHTGRSPNDKFVVREARSESDVDWGKVNQAMLPGKYKLLLNDVQKYLLPKQGVLSMHCSANVGKAGDTALFFGLSGTGKTTLSADPNRGLIGDDEHGWSSEGIFNFEGGCYAKVINLSPESEPDIYRTTQMFGTVLENVVLDPATKKVRFADQSITENTRASYPLHYIRNYVEGGGGGQAKDVIVLPADAFGVLPPIAKLTPQQAMYYFLSGYTAKVAGTERGVKEPQPTFSACFGAAFLVWHPTKYAKMLGELLRKHKSNVWLINTGWSGGPYGTGKRINLEYTRAIVNAALVGDLDNVETQTDPIFGLAVPTEIAGVPAKVLNPRTTWADPTAYDAQARKLAEMFHDNYEKFGSVEAATKNAGPKA